MIENFVKLPDLHFIAGSRQKLEIELYDDNENAFDVSSATITIAISDESKKRTYIKKQLTAAAGSSGVINTVSLELTSSETEAWSGKYFAQIQIAFSENDVIIPAEIALFVKKKIRGGD